MINKSLNINTSLFEDAIVLEDNGWLTAAGLEEGLINDTVFVKEGEPKPQFNVNLKTTS